MRPSTMMADRHFFPYLRTPSKPDWLRLDAPCTFISEVGLKRAVYAEEDTLWTTVHLTEFEKESDLDKIEQEVIAPSYDDIGFLTSASNLNKLETQGEKLWLGD